MAFHEVRFPDAISRGARGGPERRTQVVELASGDEERNASWANSRRRYDVSLRHPARRRPRRGRRGGIVRARRLLAFASFVDVSRLSRRRRPGAAGCAGQCTLTGDISFWRATRNAWRRSGTSASTSPAVVVDRVEVVEATGAGADRVRQVGGLDFAHVDDAPAGGLGKTGKVGHCLRLLGLMVARG